MQKVREHQMAVYNAQERRDEERRRTDPEFNPRDDDFDAPPVRPFDANENYYKYLGISKNATTDQARGPASRFGLRGPGALSDVSGPRVAPGAVPFGGGQSVDGSAVPA